MPGYIGGDQPAAAGQHHLAFLRAPPRQRFCRRACLGRSPAAAGSGSGVGKRGPVAQSRHPGGDFIALCRPVMIDVHRAIGHGDRHIRHAGQAAHGGIDLGRAGCAIHAVDPKAQTVRRCRNLAVAVMIVLMPVIMRMIVVIVVTATRPVVVVMVMLRMIVRMFALCRGFFRGDRLRAISETANLGGNLVEIARSIMADGHRASRNRNGDILDPAHAPHGSFNLGRAGRAIHTVDAKANLVQCFTHDLLFSGLLLNCLEQGLHPLVTRGASGK